MIATSAGRLLKLRAMPAGELLGRVRYRLRVDAERLQHRHNRLAQPERLRRALTDGAARGWAQRLVATRRDSGGRFLPGTLGRAAMRRMFETAFSDELSKTIEHAARARTRRFEFFGDRFDYGDRPIDWQADPVSGRRWPSVYHADVPVHRGDIGYGDVKYVWELNRQQFLIDLAKSHFLTGSDADLTAMRSLVQEWIAGNPYATGVNWACALEPAFRAWSWLWAYHLTASSLEDAFHLEWLAAFYDHGRFIAAHLEHHSSPYNHLIGEAAALFALGLCFQEFRESPRWRATARQVLESRLPEQFYADGGSVEQSTFYHHATLGFYLLAALIGRAHGEDLSPDVWSAIERGLEFSLAILQPDGKTPEIGGADDGKPIRMEHLPFWDFRPYLAVGAVLFDRSDFKSAAGRFYEDALWLLGPDGRDRFDALPVSSEAQSSVALRSSGYYILRGDGAHAGDYVCFDCGEQAVGMRTDAVPNSMHGHADCLSVIAWLGGRRVLVDSGLFAYNCGGAWEDHFRETAAHNTARVDGRDQARHLGKMAWSNSYRAQLEGWVAGGAQRWVAGSHDGYARGPNGVRHRRAVRLLDSLLVIYDEFIGTGEHLLEVNYQFAPGELTTGDAGRLEFDRAVSIAWSGSGRWDMDLYCGGDGPDGGWICSSLGVRQAAPRVRLSTRTSAPHTGLLVTFVGVNSPPPSLAAASRLPMPLLATLADPGLCSALCERLVASGDTR